MLRPIIPKIFLFVPANRPDRFEKAWASGADEVVLDWEDTVASADKAAARAHTAAYGRQEDSRPVWVRVNAANSPHHAEDIAAVAALPQIKGVILAKAENADGITTLHWQTGRAVVAGIETAQGMMAIPSMAQAEGLFAFTYGCLDLANDLGIRFGSTSAQAVFDRLRTDLLLYSRVNRLHPPLETTFPEFNDEAAIARNTVYWRDFGFGGVLCIHPKQVAAVRSALRPTAAELVFARKILERADLDGKAVFQVDGQMVDLPVIEWARSMVGKAEHD
ncbi:HpcH/HpaI aldolase/citrate lyase family protein [Neisseria animalis]|uniref:CoA ester lyase n=1 Tax=Neisseria animalis TaxID=492 RepID=A0A5P3MTY0_NEIAN|nr:CoA ester lyase [Neisseria animalis]QEY24221.1 CoA ester lyase [Neisseria animalis]ROW32170.1 CoA ester lyase [Neisseria animalis]VEE06551.1 Citrate lyase subunit beta-like protein [Neisseria animalis]